VLAYLIVEKFPQRQNGNILVIKEEHVNNLHGKCFRNIFFMNAMFNNLRAF